MKYTNHHILEFLEEWAPQRTKLDYDNVGLLIGDEHQEITRILVCLDVTPEVVEEAISESFDLILAHHPLIFKKLSRVTSSDPIGAMIYRLIRNDISLIAAHTNLDAARDGVSFKLAEILGLQDIRFLKQTEGADSHRYDVSDPQKDTAQAPSGLMEAGQDAGFGAVGEYPEPMDTLAFLHQVQSRLNCGGLRYSGQNEQIQKVAVCGGAGSFLASEAMDQKADAFVTADLKYHDFFTGMPSFVLVDAGHYENEVPIVRTLCSRLTDRFPDLEAQSTRINTNPVTYFKNETINIEAK